MLYLPDKYEFFLFRLNLQRKALWSRMYTTPGGATIVEPPGESVHRKHFPSSTESRRQPASLQRIAQTTEGDFWWVQCAFLGYGISLGADILTNRMSEILLEPVKTRWIKKVKIVHFHPLSPPVFHCKVQCKCKHSSTNAPHIIIKKHSDTKKRTDSVHH